MIFQPTKRNAMPILYSSGIPIIFLLVVLIASMPLVHAQTDAEQRVLSSIEWQNGPSTAELGQIAKIRIPQGYIFAGADDTRKLMELMQNPPSGTELGFLARESSDWFIVFEFDDIGYVKDDEKDSLDADAMLESIMEGNEAANEERRRRGWATLTITGWKHPPTYNPETNNLEWAIRGKSEGELVVNYNTRLLGRRGVMRVSLVTPPTMLSSVLPTYSRLLRGYSFKSGQKYAEYRAGDKIAKYGLAALVTGGAVAVAAKSGLLAKLVKSFWKILIAVIAAGAALLRKLFGGRSSSGTNLSRT